MDKRSEKTLFLAAVVTVIWLVVDMVLSQRTGLCVLPALAPYLAVALFLCLVVLVRERLARLADEEKRDQALARQERADTTIFGREEGKFEPYSVGQGRAQFERFVVPALAPVLAIGEGAWAWWLYRHLAVAGPTAAQRLLAAAFLAAQAFLFFLFSRYLLGLSRAAVYRLLRGPGVALGMACFGSVLATVSALVAEASYPPIDRLTAMVLTAFLGLLGIENVLNFIGECYRPRKDQEPNRAYESRLGGLLTDPGTWAKNVAQALDYQFGFKVSETWLYRFLENALLPLVIFQLLVLYLLSCLVFLGPDEEGILERFGKPVADGWHLSSGCHVKWPWPFETVRRFPAHRILTFKLGHRHEGKGPEKEPPTEPTVIVWTTPHIEGEEQFLVATPPQTTTAGKEEGSAPVGLLSYTIPIEYQITNVYQFAYNHAEPTELVEQIAYRSLTLESAAHGMADLLGEGRSQIAESLHRRIQAEADRLGLGIAVVFVGLQEVHPPVRVADAFEAVIAATEEKEAAILTARADAIQAVTLAEANGAKTVYEAEAYQVGRTAVSEAEAHRFQIRLETQSKSPRVFRANLYLDTLAAALADARKYIIGATPQTEVIQMNFEEKLRPELFDLGPGPHTHPEKKD